MVAGVTVAEAVRACTHLVDQETAERAKEMAPCLKVFVFAEGLSLIPSKAAHNHP